MDRFFKLEDFEEYLTPLVANIDPFAQIREVYWESGDLRAEVVSPNTKFRGTLIWTKRGGSVFLEYDFPVVRELNPDLHSRFGGIVGAESIMAIVDLAKDEITQAQLDALGKLYNLVDCLPDFSVLHFHNSWFTWIKEEPDCSLYPFWQAFDKLPEGLKWIKTRYGYLFYEDPRICYLYVTYRAEIYSHGLNFRNSSSSEFRATVKCMANLSRHMISVETLLEETVPVLKSNYSTKQG